MFELPENLTELSAEELDSLAAQANDTIGELSALNDSDFTDEQVEQFTSAADGLVAVEAEQARRTEAANERAAKLSAAREVADRGVEASTDGPEDEDAEDEETGDENVTASAAKTSTGPAAVAKRNRVEPPQRNRGPATLLAAADVPGYGTGQDLGGIDGLVKAVTEKMKRLPKKPGGTSGRRFERFGAATISRGADSFDGLTDANPDFAGNFQRLLQEAGNEKRLPDGSLTAAGGWCAPSETLYDLCERETLDGIVDIPEVNVTRGGLRFTQGPDFAQIFGGPGFCQTEAEAEAGEEKPCFDIECPPFEEVRLDACGLCIRAGILTNVGYPELIDRWISGGMTAHQHRMSARVINQIEALLGPPLDFPATDQAATTAVLGAVEAVINSQREAYRLSLTGTLEVLAPYWLRGVIRADLANRSGVELTNVTDAMIDAHFATRGANVQWLYGYQPLVDLTPADNTGYCADGYPSDVELLVYPSGTFVKGVADVIQLDTVYDTAGLQTNTYTGLFFEEGISVMKVCHGGCRISVPICISGETGANNIATCQLVGTNLSS